MKTLITIIGNVYLDSEDIEELELQAYGLKAYMTTLSCKKVKNYLYGNGYSMNDVVVTSLGSDYEFIF